LARSAAHIRTRLFQKETVHADRVEIEPRGGDGFKVDRGLGDSRAAERAPQKQHMLKKGGMENVDKLKTLNGAAFDKAYIDHEVAYHEQVIEAMDKTLIPGAQNDELKALLVKVRPAFVSPLAHAKMLQSKMTKSMD
jgi:predicted outer membrane protein